MYVLFCVDYKAFSCNQSHEHRIFFDTPLHLSTKLKGNLQKWLGDSLHLEIKINLFKIFN